MTISLERFNRLKRRVDEAKQDLARDEGSLRTLMAKLEKDFECSSVDDAKKLLKNLAKEEQVLSEAISVKLAEFEEKWGESL